MTELIVESLGASGISFGPPVPFPSVEVHEEWNRIIPQVLSFAFLNRPAWFVNAQPHKGSLGYEFTDTSTIKVGKKEYLLAYRETCTNALLEKVAESQDFKLGLFWLVLAGEHDQSHIAETICAVEASNFFASTPQLDREVLLGGFDYAETIYWFNSTRSSAEIHNELVRLAESVGWHFGGIPK